MIITTQINPPIPTRKYDWEAVRADSDEDALIGYGETPEEAVRNLEELEEE